jgi:hypothetical protein
MLQHRGGVVLLIHVINVKLTISNMKSKLNQIVWIGFTILSTVVVQKSFAQSKKTIFLKKGINRKFKASEISGIQVLFNVDTNQQKSENGLKFSIIIKNPLYFLSMSLTNVNGTDVLIKQISKLAIKPLRGKYVFRTFIVEKVKSKDKELQSIDMANTEQITIPEKSGFEIFLKIPKIFNPSSSLDKTKNSEVKLEKGKYRLFAVLGIVSSSNNNPIENNLTFILPAVIVNYGF